MKKKLFLVLCIFIYSLSVSGQNPDIDIFSYSKPNNGILQGKDINALGKKTGKDPMTNTFDAFSDLTIIEAKEVALNLIEENPNNTDNWVNASISLLIPLWSIEGLLTGYEAKVVNQNGDHAGSILIDAWDIYHPYILCWGEEGAAYFEILMDRYEEGMDRKLNQEGVRYRFLYNGLSKVALQIFSENQEYLFSFIPGMKTDNFSAVSRLDYFKSHIKQRLVEEKKNELENLNRSGHGYIHYSWPPIFQESRTWKYSSGGGHNCESGCTPVSAVIIADYWDNHSYRKIIGTETQQQHTTTDLIIRDTVDEMRKLSKTKCKNGGGATSFLNWLKFIKYFNSRGEGHWTANLKLPSVSWNTLMSEIDQKRPVMVNLRDQTNLPFGFTNHSVVAMSYTDNDPGTSKDHINTRSTWSQRPYESYMRDKMGTYQVVTVMPN